MRETECAACLCVIPAGQQTFDVEDCNGENLPCCSSACAAALRGNCEPPPPAERKFVVEADVESSTGGDDAWIRETLTAAELCKLLTDGLKDGVKPLLFSGRNMAEAGEVVILRIRDVVVCQNCNAPCDDAMGCDCNR